MGQRAASTPHGFRNTRGGKKKRKAKSTNLPHHSRPRQPAASTSSSPEGRRNFPISAARDRRR
ncbi:hypothetical protein SORBI_3010G072500 [Sorghum bicolor]|uniref:Uncharacterized protein n=1 Tax=Sorghum bicolor TaxID=4558 RepID=A0A194YHT2_SORBI|nr:hypothetical protein SORBI_3010G072500 [Sorghum bicolor]